MYRTTRYGQAWISKDGNHLYGWKGRQAYKYLSGDRSKRG